MGNDFIKITLIKSIIGRLPSHRLTILGLGLKKINSVVIMRRTAPIDGMIKKVKYLIKTEKYEGDHVSKQF